VTNAQAAAYQAQGFEIALHLSTGCSDFTPDSLANAWANQRAEFASSYPSVAPLRTNRTHCIVWSDWASEATVGLANGIRLDTNYYYYPGSWMLDRPGMFTGSGIPMRFAGLEGSLIDVYQATTQLTDEWGATIDAGVAAHIAALLDRALGPEGYYGVFTANMHTDYASHPGADAIVAAAKARGVPVISAAQLLDWLDGRNGSSFQGVAFSGGRLSFTVAGGARGLEAMVPASSANGGLLALTRNGAPVGVTPRRVKGIDYLVFDGAAGAYVATYPGGGTPPAGASRKAPRVRLMQRKARVSRKGFVRLRLRCPRTAAKCRTRVRIRHRGRVIAKRTVILKGGKTTKVKLRLTRRARTKLAKAGSLRVNVVLRVSARGRTPTVTKKQIRLLRTDK
jgi:hypothetical protein